MTGQRTRAPDRPRLQRSATKRPRRAPAGGVPAASRAAHATIRAVTTRRGGRPPQVRPRPPSTGRPAPTKVRAAAPSSTRLAPHRRVERTRGIAFPFRLVLAVAVVALGAGVLLVASGGVGRAVASIGKTFTGFVTDLTATPVPSASEITVADAPVIQPPAEPYTNQKSVDLVGTVPASIAGNADYRVRLYVALGDAPSAPVVEVPVGASQHFLVPDVQLSEGTNTFLATIVGPDDRESERSAAVTYILDTTKPRITISAPKNNGVVNAPTVQIVGQTQGRSTLSVRNVTTNTTVAGTADGAGAFAVVVPLGTGTNTIPITATDPAGNVNAAKLTLQHGTGILTAKVSASTYRIRLSSLPEPVTLSVLVTDPDGQPLSGAQVTFTLAVPGVPAIASSQVATATNGRASFTTTVPKGASKGQGHVSVIVDTQSFGRITDTTVITFN